MPSRRLCLKCNKPTDPGESRCPKHTRPAFTKTHHYPLPAGWDKLRASILQRDNHRCVLCSSRANTVDHIIPRARGGGHEPSNLRSLCPAHAREKDRADAAEGARLARGTSDPNSRIIK